MTLNTQGIFNEFAAMPVWELVAATFGIAYIFLAAKESLWTWFFAFFGTFIYTILFWKGTLISSSLLNFYYMIMAFYGFVLWRNGGDKGKELEISRWNFKTHTTVILSGIMISLALAYISDTYTEAKFAYLDTFVMIFSIIATWMLTKKTLENWLYWIIIDSAAIILYWKTGYLATIFLFIVYVFLSFHAYTSWRKVYYENRSI